MTANPHIDRLREALDTLTAASLGEADVAAMHEDSLNGYAALDALAADLDAAKNAIGRGDQLLSSAGYTIERLEAERDAAIRERDEARGDSKEWHRIAELYRDERVAAEARVAELERERDGARERLVELETQQVSDALGLRDAEMEQLRRERDEARQGIQNYIESNAALMRSATGNRDLRVAAEARVAELEAALREAYTALQRASFDMHDRAWSRLVMERCRAALAAAPTDTEPIGRCAHCGGLIRYGEDHVHDAYRPADTEGGAA